MTISCNKNNIKALCGLLLLNLGQISLATDYQAARNYHYTLGEKSYIESLYPKPALAQFYLPTATTAELIKHYLALSLSRDGIYVGDSLAVTASNQHYQVSFSSNDSRAANYAKVHPRWLSQNLAGQALNGSQLCQQNSTCWDPGNSKQWDFFLPLGLPMVNQKAVMLLHYPPFVSLQQGDYLNNNTLARWERLLMSVGVDKQDTPLYENIVDIIPIAAPGSGQSQYLPTSMATNYFDSKTSRNSHEYIGPMLSFNLTPPGSGSSKSTLPTIVFGSEALNFWSQTYLQGKAFKVLDSGRVKLDSSQNKTTPYIGANHPIAAVYQRCSDDKNNETAPILRFQQQDLSTACFAKAMSDNPDANVEQTLADCKNSWFNASQDSVEAELICINAKIDLSSYGACSWENALRWCKQHNNNACAANTERKSCQL